MASQIDLHCHTTASDGALDPEVLIDRAIGRNIETLAITDHDTMVGYRQVADYAKERGLRLIPGIELSSQWRGMGIHVVGLGMDPTHPVMIEAERSQTEVRRARAITIAERLEKKMQKKIDFAAVEALAGGEVGRPHFAQYLVEQGMVLDRQTAFKKYLGAGKVGDVKSGWPTMETVVKWIVESGGQAVLAHPHHYKLTRTKLLDCIAAFQHAGGQAMEICCGLMDKNQSGQLKKIAQDEGLLGSCGSDFHGPNKFGLDLGVMPTFPSSDELGHVLSAIPA
jgi:predicted metal-dependent phosphoesterase TrpH